MWDPFCTQLFAYTFCMNFVYKLYSYIYSGHFLQNKIDEYKQGLMIEAEIDNVIPCLGALNLGTQTKYS